MKGSFQFLMLVSGDSSLSFLWESLQQGDASIDWIPRTVSSADRPREPPVRTERQPFIGCLFIVVSLLAYKAVAMFVWKA